MRTKPALTLIELLVVMALVIIIAIPAFISLPNIKNRQALKASGENLANVLRTARIYSRAERDDKAWGVIYTDGDSYSLISGKSNSYQVAKTYSLEAPVIFPGSSFAVWFKRVTGDTDQEHKIDLKIDNGIFGEVSIDTIGIIQYKQL